MLFFLLFTGLHAQTVVVSDSASITDTITIIGVGDIMMGTNYPSESYLPPNDGKDIFDPVKEILRGADLTFGNLEGVLLSGKGNVKKCNDPRYCYAFKSPDHYAAYLKKAGFDVVSMANNHTRDFGKPGTENTRKLLTEQGIHFAGLLQDPYKIFTYNGVKYGFCAFAPNRGTVNINDYKNARKIVSHLDSLCNIVIVSFHGGGEGLEFRHLSKKREYYLNENRGNPYEFARLVIDAGADIVFGHGPHVSRAIDLYKDRFISYSMGNFCTYGRFNLRGPKGHAPILKVRVNKNGEFLFADIVSTKQTGEGGPRPDKNNSVLKEIIELTKKDITESELEIFENGLVKKKLAPGH